MMDAAFVAAVGRVVGEGHRVDRPHFMAQALQREGRRAVADAAVGDEGLERKYTHL